MSPYVFLAKLATEVFVKEGEVVKPPQNLPKEFFQKRAGTFVTIEKGGKLRGCIGTYLPTKQNIAEEIIRNAIAAAREDYRFGPVQEEELSSLAYTVYVLSEPKLVKDISQLNPQKYGIIVKTAPITRLDGTDVVFNGHMPHKSGLLLPGLEGLNTAKEQIAAACYKGGIDLEMEEIIIYRFTTEKYQQ